MANRRDNGQLPRGEHFGPEISRRRILTRGVASAATAAICAGGVGSVANLQVVRLLLKLTPTPDARNPVAAVATAPAPPAPFKPTLPNGYFHGLFTVNTVADIQRAAALGINFTVCYGWNSQQVADPQTPEGREMMRYGIKTFLNVESHLLTCANGVGVLDVEAIRKLVVRFKNSPIVAGYWTKDDDCGDERAAVKQAYDLVRSIDPNPRHLIMPGFGSARLVDRNYVHGQADILGFYPYPTSTAGRGPALEVPDMLRIVRQRTPAGETPPPFIGVYQAFGDPPARPTPTQAQILAEAQTYISHGAIGLAGYGWGSDTMSVSASSSAEVRAGVSAVSAWLSARRA